MDRRAALSTMTAIVILSALCAIAIAQETDGWMIHGAKSFTFKSDLDKYKNIPYQFTKADIDRKTCDNTQGYYWCQAQGKCLKLAKDKCKLTSTGGWYDGTPQVTAEKTAAIAIAAPKSMTPARTVGELGEKRFGSDMRLRGNTKVVVTPDSGTGLFGRQSQAQRGPARADWPKIIPTGRRSWLGQSSYIVSRQ